MIQKETDCVYKLIDAKVYNIADTVLASEVIKQIICQAISTITLSASIVKYDTPKLSECWWNRGIIGDIHLKLQDKKILHEMIIEGMKTLKEIILFVPNNQKTIVKPLEYKIEEKYNLLKLSFISEYTSCFRISSCKIKNKIRHKHSKSIIFTLFIRIFRLSATFFLFLRTAMLFLAISKYDSIDKV